MAYRIELARAEHLGYLRLLFIRLVAEQPAEYPEMDNEEFDNFVVTMLDHMQNNPHFRCYVAAIGHRIVGFLAGEITGRPIGKPHIVARPHYLYVIPKHRGRGVARQLIAAGTQWLSERGIGHVELTEQYGETLAWLRRGFTPFLVHYYLPTAAIAAKVTNGAAQHEERPHGE